MMACQVLHDLTHLYPQLILFLSSFVHYTGHLQFLKKVMFFPSLGLHTYWFLCLEHFSSLRFTLQISTELILSYWTLALVDYYSFNAFCSLPSEHLAQF